MGGDSHPARGHSKGAGSYAELAERRRSFNKYSNGNSAASLNMSAYVASQGLVGDLSRRYAKINHHHAKELSPGRKMNDDREMLSTRKKSAALRRYLQAPAPVNFTPYQFPPQKPLDPETTTSSKRLQPRRDPDLSKTAWQRLLDKPMYSREFPVTGDRKRRIDGHSPTGKDFTEMSRIINPEENVVS